jgi:predicted transposase YdaD
LLLLVFRGDHKIFKENIEQIIASLASRLMNIDLSKTIDLRGKIQYTQEREPDFLMEYSDALTQERKIGHLEIQSTDDLEMDKRELMYYGLFHLKFGLPINQTVIYVGNKPLKYMTGRILGENIDFRYRIIDIRTVRYEDFLNSDIPEIVVLAILGDFHGDSPEDIAQRIVLKLKEIVKSSFGKFTTQLQVLSKLRNLQPIVKQKIKKMPLNIQYTIEEDALYEMGLEKGITKGIENQKAIDESKRLAEKKDSVLKMLNAGLSIEQIANFLNENISFVLKIQKDLDKKK